MAERVEKTSNVLRESNLIGSVEKDLLDAISLDAQGGILLVLLKSLKAAGKFDEVRKLIDESSRHQQKVILRLEIKHYIEDLGYEYVKDISDSEAVVRLPS